MKEQINCLTCKHHRPWGDTRERYKGCDSCKLKKGDNWEAKETGSCSGCKHLNLRCGSWKEDIYGGYRPNRYECKKHNIRLDKEKIKTRCEQYEKWSWEEVYEPKVSEPKNCDKKEPKNCDNCRWQGEVNRHNKPNKRGNKKVYTCHDIHPIKKHDDNCLTKENTEEFWEPRACGFCVHLTNKIMPHDNDVNKGYWCPKKTQYLSKGFIFPECEHFRNRIRVEEYAKDTFKEFDRELDEIHRTEDLIKKKNSDPKLWMSEMMQTPYVEKTEAQRLVDESLKVDVENMKNSIKAFYWGKRISGDVSELADLHLQCKKEINQHKPFNPIAPWIESKDYIKKQKTTEVNKMERVKCEDCNNCDYVKYPDYNHCKISNEDGLIIDMERICLNFEAKQKEREVSEVDDLQHINEMKKRIENIKEERKKWVDDNFYYNDLLTENHDSFATFIVEKEIPIKIDPIDSNLKKKTKRILAKAQYKERKELIQKQKQLKKNITNLFIYKSEEGNRYFKYGNKKIENINYEDWEIVKQQIILEKKYSSQFLSMKQKKELERLTKCLTRLDGSNPCEKICETCGIVLPVEAEYCFKCGGRLA